MVRIGVAKKWFVDFAGIARAQEASMIFRAPWKTRCISRKCVMQVSLSKRTTSEMSLERGF